MREKQRPAGEFLQKQFAGAEQDAVDEQAAADPIEQIREAAGGGADVGSEARDRSPTG